MLALAAKTFSSVTYIRKNIFKGKTIVDPPFWPKVLAVIWTEQWQIMSEVKKKKMHAPALKAETGLEALHGVDTGYEIVREHGDSSGSGRPISEAGAGKHAAKRATGNE